MIVTPSSVDVPVDVPVDSPVDIPELTKPAGPQRRISERSTTAGTVTTDTESMSLSSVGSESEDAAEEEESSEATSIEVPETSFSHLSISTTTATSTCASSSSSSSILKRRTSASELSYIKDSKRAWKCLPKPDLNTIIGDADTFSTTETTAKTALNDSLSSRTSTGTNKGVEWGVVQIRSYGQTIGDNPSVSYGTPIQLDWDYEAHEPVELVDYETNRGARRTLRQMVLSYYHRKNVLAWQYGHTEGEIKAAKKEASRTKLKREITRSLLMTMPAEAVVESARRKAKRFFEKKEE
eukprot:CAMPEP_0113610556 /NCGR_PEP_ID=MMETSP0017_2-20120614/5090_1 /TAXON_ID=2856 /ORGANISM="Cylindrotheca closterium" /LENGTH=295 /DNA_ID=CAMNT_0000519453 /DNA_START=136 /DNA_END=1023 /DNA_ORIENTATION=+ /assembly_acc=CAM_ASM_000147